MTQLSPGMAQERFYPETAPATPEPVPRLSCFWPAKPGARAAILHRPNRHPSQLHLAPFRCSSCP